jgi:hypothetical protein
MSQYKGYVDEIKVGNKTYQQLEESWGILVGVGIAMVAVLIA